MSQDGYPELRRLYRLHNAEDKVALFPAVHFGHNFNHVSRVHMYDWVNQHFDLGYDTPILERDFDLLGPEELSVWDEQHPHPPQGEEFERELLQLWSEIVDAQLTGLLQGDVQQVQQLMEVLEDGWRVCLGLTALPAEVEVTAGEHGDQEIVFSAAPLANWSLLRKQTTQPKADNSDFGQVAYALEEHAAILEPWQASSTDLHIKLIAADGAEQLYHPRLAGTRQTDNQLLKTSHQALVENPRLAAAYTYGYNPPLLATQAQQLGLSLNWLRLQHPDHSVVVSAQGAEAALAAAGIFCAQQMDATGESPSQFVLDIEPGSFSFKSIDDIRHNSFLPGSVRYWDLPGLVSCLRKCEVKLPVADVAPFTRLLEICEMAGTQVTNVGQ